MNAREYQTGEEPQLLAVWSRAYGHLGGYVARTLEHWRWAVLDRPGVEAADVRVVESAAAVIAYGALGPGGSILELAVDPGQPPRRRTRALQLLLEALEARARHHDYDTMTCSAPMADPFIARAMARAGYHTDEGVFVGLGMIDPLGVIRQILAHRRAQLEGWQQRFVLELAPGQYRDLPQSRLAIELGENLGVSDSSARVEAPCHCRIRTDLTVLTDILFGSVPAVSCLARGMVTVEPVERSTDALRLLDILSVRTPWQVPTSDVF